MIKTVILLIASLVLVPAFSVMLGVMPDVEQMALLRPLLWMCFFVATACFILSELTRNFSQVDKIWSIVPIVYVGYVAVVTDFSPRVLLMFFLALLWGARLTYNFTRRGGYSWRFWTGEEDYRWAVLRAKPEFQGRFRWTLFNLFFISFYQNYLILFFTLPVVVVAANSGQPLGYLDYLIAVVILGLIIMETVADQQQWTYQKEKYRRIESGEPLTGKYALGFVHNGLWRWMRHPNYSAEQTIWVCFYFFSVLASGNVLNWSLSGPLLLLVLFQGSADFSEGISAAKYPAYKHYIEQVGCFLPRFWKQFNPKG
jgi:steroid 5-alpha reductase family enzyme